jgi:hypothetical protein
MYTIKHNHQLMESDMTKIWTSPETKAVLLVVVTKEYDAAGEPMFLVHKATATSSKYVFGIRARDCR